MSKRWTPAEKAVYVSTVADVITEFYYLSDEDQALIVHDRLQTLGVNRTLGAESAMLGGHPYSLILPVQGIVKKKMDITVRQARLMCFSVGAALLKLHESGVQ